MFLFIFELFIINFFRFFIRLNSKLILFSGCANNHNINNTVGVCVTVVNGVSFVEHAPYNSVPLSIL